MKTVFYQTISFVFLWVVMSTTVLAQTPTPRATILLYHGLTEECPTGMYEKRKDRFYDDMMYIKENFDVISMSDLQDIIENKKTLERSAVVITFDDGMKSNYDIAAPILKELGLPASFFIIASLPGVDDFFMTWDQIKELSQVKGDDGKYLFTIGSHAFVSEYPGLQSPGINLTYELGESKKVIERYITPRLCESFAVPFGLLPTDDNGFRDLAKSLGYKIIRTSETRNVNIATDNLLNLPCLPLYDMTQPDYIGAFNQSATTLLTPLFRPAQDIFSDYNPNQPNTFSTSITDITSYYLTGNSQNISITAVAENNDLIQSVEVKRDTPTKATINITTKPGVCGRAKINIEARETGTHPSTGYFHLIISPGMVILAYNGVTADTPDNFFQRSLQEVEKDLKFINDQGYEVISMEDMLKVKAGNKYVKNKVFVLSFDDGGIVDYDSVIPLLQQYGFPATFFIVPKWVGKEGYMSWDNIKTMLQKKDTKGNSLFSVGSHSYAHEAPGYLNFTNEEIFNDLKLSKETIEKNTSAECNFVAFPYGAKTGEPEVAAIAASLGYKGIRSPNDTIFNVMNQNFYEMSSITPYSYTPVQYFASLFNQPRNATAPLIDPVDNNITTDIGKSFVVDIKGIASTYYPNNEKMKVEVTSDNPSLFEKLNINYVSPSPEAKLNISLNPQTGRANVTVKVHENLGVSKSTSFQINKTEAVNVRNVTILVYNGLIDGCPRSMYEKRKDRFYADMQYIKNNLDVISLSDLLDVMDKKKILQRDAVVITFDKGMRSNYDIAVPILKEFGFPATFFIVGSIPDTDEFFMTWDQITELSQNNLFTIGSNTYSAVNEYPGLKELASSKLRYELEESKKLIDHHIAPRKCEALAVPFGLIPENEIDFRSLATELGYKMIRASMDGENVDILKKQPLNLPSLLLYDFTKPEYIGETNKIPVKTPIFEPVQDVFFKYTPDMPSYQCETPLKGIRSHFTWNSKNIDIKITPENYDLIEKIEVDRTAPWDSASIKITTKKGVYGRTRVNIELSEAGTYPSSGYFHVTIEPVAEIISYNGITSNSPGNIYQRHYRDFVEDMKFIYDQGYEVISMDDLLKVRAGEKTIKNKVIVLCFDDGGMLDFQLVKPVLQQYGFPATFFIVPDWVGKNGYMTWDNINALLQEKDAKGNRLFSAGSHSFNHIEEYKNLTYEQLFEDFKLSKQAIEDNTSAECNFLALPYGAWSGDVQVMSLAKLAGYKGIRTSNDDTFSVLSGNLFNMGTLFMYSYITAQNIESFFEQPRLTAPLISPVQDILRGTADAFVVDIKGIESTYFKTNNNIKLEVETDNPQFFENLKPEYKAPDKTAKLNITIKPHSGEAFVTLKVHEDLGISGVTRFKIEALIKTTGEKDISREPVILFPNPATDRIELKNVDENILFKMYNEAGSLVLAGRGNKINISVLPQGVYILALYSGNEEVSKLKFVKR